MRPSIAASVVERAVATRVSTTDAAIEGRMRELMQPHYDKFMSGQTDGAELPRQKEEARAKATAEHGARSALDAAFATYTAAVQAREAAYVAYAAAEEREAAAEQAVYAALSPLEGSSSGVKPE